MNVQFLRGQIVPLAPQTYDQVHYEFETFDKYKLFPIGLLLKAEWNYKETDEKLGEKLRNNLKRNGQIENILVRELETGYYEVVNGNHRLDEMLKIGKEMVLAYDLGKISLPEAQRIAVETNETKFATDEAKLKSLLQELQDHFDFADLKETMPFDDKAFQTMLDDLDTEGVQAEDRQASKIKVPEKPISQINDLYELVGESSTHRIYCADSTVWKNYEKLLAGETIDMGFTDPPYNVSIKKDIGGGNEGIKERFEEFAMASGEMSEEEFTVFLKNIFEHFCRASKDGAIHYYCMDWKHQFELLDAARRSYPKNPKDFKKHFKNMCVWNKDNGGMGTFYRSKHELVFVFKNGTAPNTNNFELGQYGRYRTNVWDYAMVNSFGNPNQERSQGEHSEISLGNYESKLHPTPKPVQMVADAILDCSNPKENILDCFLNGGATLLACEQTKRNCYGLELNPAYLDVIVARWLQSKIRNQERFTVRKNGKVLEETEALAIWHNVGFE